MDCRKTVHITDRVIEQGQAVQVRDPHHIYVGIQQIAIHGFDLYRFTQGQCDVQASNVMDFDQLQQFLLRAYDRWCTRRQPGGGIGADQTDQWEMLEGAKLVGQSQCQLTSSDDQRSTLSLK
ncbi:hypothetical protein D3C87_1388950 [compost metagenome]